MKNQISSVNFHLWEPCNMRCKFCFATFQDVKQSILPSGHLPQVHAKLVVKNLARYGFEKITFAGGEPTLCPWLSELIKTAKQAGMTTMIVTNGSRLNDAFLLQNKNYLDWIAISIDSLNPETNLKCGRAISGKTSLTVDNYKSLVEQVKLHGYGLKINTVVNSKNFMEDMNEFMQFAKPRRWKVLQVLPIEGQNDDKIDEFEISETEFQNFVIRHQKLTNVTTLIPESNKQMTSSYVMVDPAGRFFDNASGKHNYSRPILEAGVCEALKDVNYDFHKFNKRGGTYDWEIEKSHKLLRISISGEVASGKSTVGKLLAQELNYDFTSIGNKIREVAAKREMSIVEFQRVCLQNPDIDFKIDQEFSDDCNARAGLVIDYRMGFKFIKNAYHIFLKISEEAAIERLKSANRDNETYHTVKERNESFKNQFQKAYGIDYTNERNYDLVIKIDKNTSSESIAKVITRNLLRKRIPFFG